MTRNYEMIFLFNKKLDNKKAIHQLHTKMKIEKKHVVYTPTATWTWTRVGPAIKDVQQLATS